MRRRYHFGTAGLTYIFVTILVALGAFNSQNNLLFWTLGFAMALLLVSGALSGSMLMGIELERVGISPPRAGEPCTITYRVRNRNRFIPAFALSIAEVQPPGANGGVGSSKRSNKRRATRSITTSRDDWTKRLPEPRAFVAHVGAGQSALATTRVIATDRGPGQLTAVLVSTSFPFGIVRKSLLFEQATSFIAHPARVKVEPSLLRETIRMGERGTSPTRRAGPGAEFFSLREYRSGDGTKSIAWRASARRGELLVRQPAAPSPVRVAVMLDLDPTASMARTEQAIRFAGSLIDSACERRLEIGLFAPATGLHVAAKEGRLHQARLLDALGDLDTDRLSDSPVNAATLANETSLAAVVVVHSGDAAEWAFSLHGALHVTPEMLDEGTPIALSEHANAAAAPSSIGTSERKAVPA